MTSICRARAAALLATFATVLVSSFACDRAREAPSGRANASDAHVVSARADGPRRAGVNLNGFQYYGTTLPFVDVFRHFDRWISQDDSRDGLANGQWDDAANPIEVCELGFPVRLGASSERGHRQVATCLLLYESGGHYPAGEYTLLWEGTARFEVAAGGRVTSSSPGRMVVDVTRQNSGVRLRLVAMDERDPVRAIRFVMPGHEATYREQPFNPEWLALLEPFATVRTMDWQRTNGSPLARWQDRTTLRHATQARAQGCAPEVLVELARALPGKQIRVQIPHLADDDYVRRFAEFLRDGAPKDARFGVEYSNETWNRGFPQAAYVVERGRAARIPGSDHDKGQRYTARRSREIFAIFRDVFGDARERITCIVAGQNIGEHAARTLLSFEDTHRVTDEYAIAPYFAGYLGDPEHAAATKRMTIEEVHAAMLAEIRGEPRRGAHRTLPRAVAEARAVADEFRVRLVAYESGNHAFAVGGAVGDRELVKLLEDADAHPGMEAVYVAYHEMLAAQGLELPFQFTDVGWPNPWGAWGMVRHLGATDAPKHRGLLAWLAGGGTPPRDDDARSAGSTPSSRTARVWTRVLSLDDPFVLGTHEPIADARTQALPHAGELHGACHLCHRDVVAEWSKSQHALAWIDEHFQASLEGLRNPQACHGCHIPEPLHVEGRRFGGIPFARTPQAEPWHFGVSCATCHLASDGETWLGPSADAQAPHPAAQGENFVGTAVNRLCIDCHRRNVGPVLGIAQEYERSALPGQGVRCIDCHFAPVERATMPGSPVRSGRSHDLLGPRDPLFLAQAFAPAAERAGDVTRVVLANRAGHRVPGLVGRRLHFDAVLVDAEGGEVARGAWTIDDTAPLALGERRVYDLPGVGTHVRLSGRHEAPGWKDAVPFLEVLLEVNE